MDSSFATDFQSEAHLCANPPTLVGGSLDAVENKLTNLSGIEGLTKLMNLSAGYNKLTDVKGIENLTNLIGLGVGNNKLKRLPDLTKLTELEAEGTYFAFNQLPENELVEKLPLHLLKSETWLTEQIKLQNATRTLKLTTPSSFNKITAKTNKIVGVAQRNATVRIKHKDKTISSVKANTKGVFKFKKLNLKKYKGKNLTMRVFYKGYRINLMRFTVR